jgi:hypothetical protein
MSEFARNVCLQFVENLHERIHDARTFELQLNSQSRMEALLILCALEDCQPLFQPQGNPKPICRFSMGQETEDTKSEFQQVLVNDRAGRLMQRYAKKAVSKLSESLVDFSLSNYSLAQAAGRKGKLPAGERFELLMIAESEMGTKDDVLEDFLKLTCVYARFKAIVYKAPKQKASRKVLVEGFERIIQVARKAEDKSEWLFLGIPAYLEWIETWENPSDLTTQVLYLGPEQHNLVSHDEWWVWPT